MRAALEWRSARMRACSHLTVSVSVTAFTAIQRRRADPITSKTTALTFTFPTTSHSSTSVYECAEVQRESFPLTSGQHGLSAVQTFTETDLVLLSTRAAQAF